jgi:hypothetical protein
MVGQVSRPLSPVSYAYEHGVKSSQSIESSIFGRGSIASRDSIDFEVYCAVQLESVKIMPIMCFNCTVLLMMKHHLDLPINFSSAESRLSLLTFDTMGNHESFAKIWKV